MKDTPGLAAEFTGAGHLAEYTLNLDKVEQTIGIPRPWVGYPLWFRRRVRLLSGDRRRPPKKVGRRKAPERYSELAKTMYALNYLAAHTDGADCLNFLPCPGVTAQAERLAPYAPQRSADIETIDYLKLLNESIKWLYDRREAFVELLSAAREVLVKSMKDSPSVGPEAINQRVAAHVAACYAHLNVDGLFPYQSIGLAQGVESLSGLVTTAQSAMFVLIASNHGRRSNEVIGHGVPYGLSLSSLRSIGNGFEEWSIEFYVEKTIQDYDDFPCNDLVADAVSFLIDIYHELRGLDAPPVMVPSDREEGRRHKLFTSRPLTVLGLRGQRFEFGLRQSLKEFFRLANVDYSKFAHRLLPYRRMFSCLFMHRYDCAELLALSRQHRHYSPDQTLPYYTDAPNGKTTPKVRVALARRKAEAASVQQSIVEGRTAYLAEKVKEMFDGSTAGGFFPRLVLRLAKRLSASASFRLADVRDKSKVVTDILQHRGYEADPLPHCICMARNPTHTKKMGNCFREGELHKEDASPEKCHRCIHNLNNENNLAVLGADVEASLAKSEDFQLPPAIRARHASHAKRLADLISLERTLSEETRAQFRLLEVTWVQTFQGDSRE
ncbi:MULTISPECIES: hypothetical protein [Paraburkholderia]|nr:MULTISPECIES: hypothetical protein [Paraburkholderia]MDR8397035.1 hypothetical protein [Paraburkholderia sp. USG1]